MKERPLALTLLLGHFVVIAPLTLWGGRHKGKGAVVTTPITLTTEPGARKSRDSGVYLCAHAPNAWGRTTRFGCQHRERRQ